MAQMPQFDTWEHNSLARFAKDCFERLKLEQAANEQLRQDFKDAMALVRNGISNGAGLSSQVNRVGE